MNVVSFLKSNIWVVFVLSIAVGWVFATELALVASFTTFILMLILFVTFLKIDFVKLKAELNRVNLIAYLTVVNLVLIPLFLFLVLSFLNISTDVKLVVLLLGLMPAAASSPALTSVFRGNVELETLLTVTTSVFAPFTVTSLFLFFVGRAIVVDYVSFFASVAILVLVPLAAAWTLKDKLHKFVSKRGAFFDVSSLVLLALLFAGNIAKYKPDVVTVDLFWSLVLILSSLIVMTFASLVAGVFLNRDDRVSFCASKVFMNILLAIALSSSFLASSVTLLVTLAIIPWSVMLIIFEKLLEKKE